MPTGIDIDSTIANTMDRTMKLLNKKYGTSFTTSMITEWDISKSLKLTSDQTAYLNMLFQDEAFYASLQPLSRAVEGVNLIADRDEVVYISSRPMFMAECTVEWLDKFGFPVGEVIMLSGDKVKTAREYGCEAFVEDSPQHVVSIATHLKIPVYMISWPWNMECQKTLNKNIKNYVIVVKGWGDIIDLLTAGEEE